MERREGRKEGSDEAGWKKQEDCSLMEEGRGEEGSETGAAWDGRSGDKLSDTVEFATESGSECPCGGAGELFLDGERREEKRDREEGREGGGGRRRGPFVPRPSTSEDRSTNRRRRKTEGLEVEVGRRRRVATRWAAIARSLARSVAGNVGRIRKCVRQRRKRL